MRLKRLAVSAAIAFALTTSAAFAIPAESAPKHEENQVKHKHGHKDWREFEKDPIKALEQKKEKVLKLYNDGKLTKEKADEIISKIDSKILDIKAFQKLPLNEKKEKLLKDCEIRLNKMVKEGRIDQKTAEDQFKEYVEKINKWGGNGYPMFRGKGMRNKHH